MYIRIHTMHVKVQMFVMLVATCAGHLPELMIRLSCYLTSLMLLGAICVAMVTRIVVLLTTSALLATALFDRETNCRKAASVSEDD